MADRNHRTIAYFSMEIGLASDMPTYSGGLGVLAGDTIRASKSWRSPRRRFPASPGAAIQLNSAALNIRMASRFIPKRI